MNFVIDNELRLMVCVLFCVCEFVCLTDCVLCVIVFVCISVFYVTYNKGVGSGFRDVYNSYRIMIKRLLPK